MYFEIHIEINHDKFYLLIKNHIFLHYSNNIQLCNYNLKRFDIWPCNIKEFKNLASHQKPF